MPQGQSSHILGIWEVKQVEGQALDMGDLGSQREPANAPWRITE